MRLTFSMFAFAAIAMGGCAGQAPADQIKRAETVRVCQGNQCTEQHRSTITRQAPAADTEAERRLQALEQLAERSPQAAYDLGLRLLGGDGVERNSYQAMEWMRQAAEKGLSEAQLALGRLYLHGFEEMGSDPAEAESWLSRAATNGQTQAKALLAEAQKAKQQSDQNYQIQAAERAAWQAWYRAAPYYWAWGSNGWYAR